MKEEVLSIIVPSTQIFSKPDINEALETEALFGEEVFKLDKNQNMTLIKTKIHINRSK